MTDLPPRLRLGCKIVTRFSFSKLEDSWKTGKLKCQNLLLHFSFLCDTASLTNNQTGNQLCETHIEFYVRHLSCQPDTSSFLLDTLSYLVRHIDIIVYFVLRSVLMNLMCQVCYRTGVAKCPSQL